MAFDGTLKFDTAIDKTGFKLGLDSLGSIAQKGMAAVTTAVTAASGAVSALGGYAVSVGKNFESSMATVIATMGITKDTIQDGVNSYDLLKEAAASAGESTVFSASEAADALNYLALAGYDAAKAADALPAVLDLAAAGGLDLAYASDLATDAMSALGIEATSENLTRFGDEMAKTASKANTSVGQLGEAILTVGGTAKSLAGGTTELNAALGVLANRGIKGSEGGTALRNIILALSAPTDKAAQALDGLGVSAFDADGNLRPLNEIFSDLDSALAGMSEGDKTQVLNEIFNKVDLKSAQAMLAGCGEEFDTLTSELENCDGAMAQMADTMNDTLEGDLKSLGSKAEAFGNAIYDGINAPLRELAQLGGEYISQLTAAFREGGFEGLAESFGDVLGQAVTKISEYLPDIAEMGASVITSLIDGLIENSGTLSDAALQVLTTILTCGADILPQIWTAGIEIIGTLSQGLSEAAPALFDTAANGIVQLISGLTENFPMIANAAVSIISSFGDTLSSNMPRISKAAEGLIRSFTGAVTRNAPELIKTAVSVITTLVNVLIENAPLLLDSAILIIETLVTALLENIDPLIDAAVQIVFVLSEYLVNNIDVLLEAVLLIIATLIQAMIDNVPELLAAALTLFGAIITAVAEIQIKFFEAIKAAGEEAINRLADTISAAGKSIADGFSNMLTSAKNGASDILDGIKEFFSQIPDSVSEFLSDAIDNVVQWGEDLLKKGKNAAKDLVDSIVTGVMSLPEELKNIGIDLVKGLWEGIKSMIGWIGDNISDFTGDIVDDFKSFLGIHSPSTVMRDRVGKYIAQGIGEGITQELPEVGEDALRIMEDLKFVMPDVELPKQKPVEIDPAALQAVENVSPVWSPQPSATSEIINNAYNYSTVNTNNSPSETVINAQFIIGDEVVADGVVRLAGDRLDEEQGVKVQLKERGLTQ